MTKKTLAVRTPAKTRTAKSVATDNHSHAPAKVDGAAIYVMSESILVPAHRALTELVVKPETRLFAIVKKAGQGCFVKMILMSAFLNPVTPELVA